jgi:hypothetical protein
VHNEARILALRVSKFIKLRAKHNNYPTLLLYGLDRPSLFLCDKNAFLLDYLIA